MLSVLAQASRVTRGGRRLGRLRRRHGRTLGRAKAGCHHGAARNKARRRARHARRQGRPHQSWWPHELTPLSSRASSATRGGRCRQPWRSTSRTHRDVGERSCSEGDCISIDGTDGEVFLGAAADRSPTSTTLPDAPARLGRRVRVSACRANADYPRDAERARRYGREGIGLCRTEHMFFEAERLPLVQRMIMAPSHGADEALDQLLPLQRSDFEGLFRAMDGFRSSSASSIRRSTSSCRPTTTSINDLGDLKIQLRRRQPHDIDQRSARSQRTDALERSRRSERPTRCWDTRASPRALMPGLTRMQVRAIFEAAVSAQRDGIACTPR